MLIKLEMNNILIDIKIIKKLIEYMRESYKWIIMISHDNFIKTFYDSELKIKKISEIESKLYF